MGKIGRFIDRACAMHPELMTRVLDRPFGDIHNWINFDEEGEACGCLIGTMALCDGFDYKIDSNFASAIERVAALTNPCELNRLYFGTEAYRVGIAVAQLATRLGVLMAFSDGSNAHVASPQGDARTAELIKRRIARRLSESDSLFDGATDASDSNWRWNDDGPASDKERAYATSGGL